MSEVKFDMGRWLNADRGDEQESRSGETCGWTQQNYLFEHVETLVSEIEVSLVNLTKTYEEWLNIGYSLADGLGVNGRIYFHRLSIHNPMYTFDKAEILYAKCLSGKRKGINISYLFDKAREAGIKYDFIKSKKPSKPTKPTGVGKTTDMEDDKVSVLSVLSDDGPLPTFSDQVEGLLPGFLGLISVYGQTYQEKDVLLLGAIVTLSACLPNVYGRYAGMEVYPNLFFFLTARASSGKGRLNLCRLLVQPIHDKLYKEYQAERKEYLKQKAAYEARRSKCMVKPDPPIKHLLFIPANSSATSVYQILSESDERGLIFETEGDTLAYAFASDFGNFSDGFRKAFHHEPISYHRRTDDEHVDIKHPQLSTVLSGTPEQLRSLIRDTENGLFSRFIFYSMNTGLDWMDVFSIPKGPSLDDEFAEMGQTFTAFYERLCKTRRLYFQFKPSQNERFHRYFSQLQFELYNRYGENMIASVRRMGLIFYRIAMILTTLRIMQHGDYVSDMFCLDIDFDNTMKIVNVIIRHTVAVYKDLCSIQTALKEANISIREKFYRELPMEFDWDAVWQKAQMMRISNRTAERYIAHYCKVGALVKESTGLYRKVEPVG